MAPFRGLFEPITFGDQSVLDTSLLFAMIVYGIVALFLRAAIDWVTERIAQRRVRLQAEAAATESGLTTSPSPTMLGADESVRPAGG